MTLDVIVPTVAVSLAITVAVAMLLPWVGAALLHRFERVSSAVWAALVLAPVIAGALVGLALLAPAPFGTCHCTMHSPHHPHLCLAHPQLASSLLEPAVMLIIVWAALAARGLWSFAGDAVRAARWSADLGGQQLCIDGVRVRVTDCGAPIAVAAGAFSPEIVFDRDLWTALNGEQRRVVVQHERAHLVRGDGLTLQVLRAAAALALIPLPGRLIQAWRTSAELDCDRHASTVVGDPLAVASTLLSVERMCKHAGTGALAHGMLGARPGVELERRVKALIDLRKDQTAALSNDLLVVSCLVGAVGLLVFAWPTGSVHHGLETLLGWALG